MKDICGWLLLFTACVYLHSCKHETTTPAPPVIPPVVITCDTVNVKYSVQVKAVLSANCLRCHGSSVYMSKGSGYNFDDYTVLKQEVDNGNVARAINHSPGAVPMPLDQTGKISDCAIRTMMIWIAAGAPNN